MDDIGVAPPYPWLSLLPKD